MEKRKRKPGRTPIISRHLETTISYEYVGTLKTKQENNQTLVVEDNSDWQTENKQ